MKKKTDLTVHIVLDRSGSMEPDRSKTMKSVNDYIADLAKGDPKSKVSITLFGDTTISTIVKDVEVGEFEPLTTKEYMPDGMTPLFDAIGHCVGLLDDATGKNKALVIVTDGMENASTKFTADQVKEMLSDRQEMEKWLVIYLGADHDAFEQGSSTGAKFGSTMSFSKAKMGAAFNAASASTMRYAASGLAAAEFTEDERKASE